MLKVWTLKMFLNFIVVVQEPWKASESEYVQQMALYQECQRGIGSVILASPERISD